MCGQGTFRFFSRNMKAVHLYLSLSFFVRLCALLLFVGFLLANISSWLGYITICRFSMKLTVSKILHLNVDGNQLGLKKVPVYVWM